MSFADPRFGLPKFSGNLVRMSPNLEALGQAVYDRRSQLGLTQDQVTKRGGPSDTTLTKIENATTTPSPSTLRKLDAGLAWTPGSARRVLDGTGTWEESGYSPADIEGDVDVTPEDHWIHSVSTARDVLLWAIESGTGKRAVEMLSRASELIDQALEILQRGAHRNAQEPESQQGTGGSAGRGTGGGGTPMTGAESETPVRDPIPDHLSGESTRSAQ